MTYINQLSQVEGKSVTLKGWVFNRRDSKGLLFIILRDGTGFCQCIVEQAKLPGQVWNAANELTQESSLELTGTVIKDDRSMGGYEVHATDVRPIQISENYPITPKEHGIEFLMDNRHLWLRSRRQWAIMRVRNEIIYTIHRFFQDRGFLQMDAPIFTGNAAEGTTNLFETDYFDEKAYLTQSGQLYAEALAMAHGRVYTFGPTFRAEKSKTRRHLTEFWMIEPEMAFYDLDMNMELAESLLTTIVQTVLSKCMPELEILERNVANLMKIEGTFPRISYTDAVERLRSDVTKELLGGMKANREKERDQLQLELKEITSEFDNAKKFRKAQIEGRQRDIRARLEEIDEDLRNIPVWEESALSKQWGDDLGGSDETILTLQYDKPVIVHNYPSEIKAFYMKRNPSNPKLALAMDVLAPEGYGEIIGGSQREDNLSYLLERIQEHNLPEEAFKWYLDLRRFGSVPHAGFGLGLERTVAWVCGLKHVRETIPFARTLGRLYP
jgi:asparaginyl-tRNA synthetase